MIKRISCYERFLKCCFENLEIKYQNIEYLKCCHFCFQVAKVCLKWCFCLWGLLDFLGKFFSMQSKTRLLCERLECHPGSCRRLGRTTYYCKWRYTSLSLCIIKVKGLVLPKSERLVSIFRSQGYSRRETTIQFFSTE